MRSMLRVGVCVIALAPFTGRAHAAEFILQPVSASGSHTILGNEIRLNGGNQRVFLELQMRGWAPFGLRTYQAKLDSSGYFSGPVGTIMPASQACNGRNTTGHAQCVAAFGDGPRCNVPPSPDPATTCEPGFIHLGHVNYVFAGHSVATAVVDISSLNYRYASVLNPGDTAVDTGAAKYGGTLVLDVPAGAQGTFTIGFQEGSGLTYMADENNEEIFPLTTTPAKISIVCTTNANCNDDNLCTTDSCNVQTGVCSNTPNYNTATHCCNPATGGLVVLSDGNQCTDDVCNTATGQVTHPNSAALTPCGNSTNTQCDRPDSCDGNGACNSRIEPAGTACGSATSTDCDQPDTCNGAGACQSNLRPSGFPCGSASDTDCDNPDTCNGIGGCLANNEPNGTPCNDGLFCTTGERCDNAVCTGGTPRNCADLLTCTDDSCNEATDQCDSVRQADTCLIDGVCYMPGDLRPTNTCEHCDPSQSGTSWSTRPDGSPCNDGDACTGTGRPGIGIDICTGGTCAGAPDPECNDDCEFAVPVVVGVNTSNNNNAGADDGEASCQPDSNNDVWFKFTANCDGATFVSTTGSALAPSNDTVLSIHTNCPALGGTQVACDDDSGVGLQSALVFATTTSTTYWIRVAGFEPDGRV